MRNFSRRIFGTTSATAALKESVIKLGYKTVLNHMVNSYEMDADSQKSTGTPTFAQKLLICRFHWNSSYNRDLYFRISEEFFTTLFLMTKISKMLRQRNFVEKLSSRALSNNIRQKFSKLLPFQTQVGKFSHKGTVIAHLNKVHCISRNF